MKILRRAGSLLILIALANPALAQLEYLTVRDIFDAVDFLAAHPESPASYATVSPFGPDRGETRMPEILTDVATQILRCYRGTARYHDADVTRAPWQQTTEPQADRSALIRIRYFESAATLYEMNVGLLGRQDALRVAVVADTAPTPSNAACPLTNWTPLRP